MVDFKNWIGNKFYLFGSEDSIDYDILVEVDEISPNVTISSDICKKFNEKISNILKDKPVNSNIGIIKNGKIVKLFKGTCDELNNVLFYTFNNHKQFFKNPITKIVERDINLKILRVARFILTFYSRTSLRKEIKKSLRGDLKLKLEVLKKIDFTTMTEFPGKNETLEDIRKVLAFQFGQVFSLLDGYESDSYTKSGISKNYPELKNLLYRGDIENKDLIVLNEKLDMFISLIERKIGTIPLTEY